MIAVSNGSERSFGTFSVTTPAFVFQLPLVAAGARVHTLRRAFVAGRSADHVSSRLQQRVQRLLDAGTHYRVHVPAQFRRIDSNRVLQSLRCILCHGGLAVVWGMVCLAATIEPDRGHRLECPKTT